MCFCLVTAGIITASPLMTENEARIPSYVCAPDPACDNLNTNHNVRKMVATSLVCKADPMSDICRVLDASRRQIMYCINKNKACMESMYQLPSYEESDEMTKRGFPTNEDIPLTAHRRAEPGCYAACAAQTRMRGQDVFFSCLRRNACA